VDQRQTWYVCAHPSALDRVTDVDYRSLFDGMQSGKPAKKTKEQIALEKAAAEAALEAERKGWSCARWRLTARHKA
jgi:hypothetical protein